MSDSKYFQTQKKGEIFELKNELMAKEESKKQDAVKKVIAAMTVGKDVSMLFTDVINCMQTTNIELKKLVYLYLMNYAKSKPDLAILAVNTFVKDSQDPNPLIRALAVRTMGCIRVDRIVEYLCEPLRRCLTDSDPYVRKTSAICVAKLYDLNTELVEDQGFIEMLQDLLSDQNPMVVANTVASLAEISEHNPAAFKITPQILNKLLAALNECTEWGQVFILDSLASRYKPQEPREAESVIERIMPRLQHANSAVVLSAVKVVLAYLQVVSNTDFVNNVYRKLTPPLITLVTTPISEIQYVALRNISLIVQRMPTLLVNDMKVFVCKYFDPVYVKMEKLEIMVQLCVERNVEQVLLELKEYATEVDVEFVRRAVRCIGRIAIKISSAAEHAINVLLDLIHTKVNYVVQEAVIVIKDIFRRYPNKYEGIISSLCESLDTLDNPEAKAAMIWIIGEYAGRINNSGELMESFLETFEDEPAEVQLQLLTATVKLFLKKPQETQELVQTVLNLATQESDNPDLRDRGYIYWRLLSTDPEASKAVVLAEKPLIKDDTGRLNETLLQELLGNLALLSSVYHKPAASFIAAPATAQPSDDGDSQPSESQSPSQVSTPSPTAALPQQPMPPATQPMPQPQPQPQAVSQSKNDLLLDLDDEEEQPAHATAAAASFASSSPTASSAPSDLSQNIASLDLLSGVLGSAAVARATVLTADKARGLQIESSFALRDGQIVMDWQLSNKALQPLSDFAVQINKNSFKLTASDFSVPYPIQPGASFNTSIVLQPTGQLLKTDPINAIQIAIKNNIGVFYFQDIVPMNVLCAANGQISQEDFLAAWKMVPDDQEATSTVQNALMDPEEIKKRFRSTNIFFIAERNPGNNSFVQYYSVRLINSILVLLEVTLHPTLGTIDLCLRTKIPDVAQPTLIDVAKLLHN